MIGGPSARRRRAWRGWAPALLAGLVLLAGCGAYNRFDDAPLTDPSRTDVLAPYEAARWPDYLHRLELPRARDYVIVSFLPTNQPFDLGAPERARHTLQDALLSPGFDTKIGHTIVAWQCGPHRGMTSMTGAKGPESTDMLKQGWGFVAALSTYTDGTLYPEGEHRLANLNGIEAGRAVVTAVEVTRRQCEAMRRELTRFVTHPNQPVRNFGLMYDPADYEGAGCISFAFHLAGAAGVMREVAPHIRRDIALRPPMLGKGAGHYPGVVLYHPPAGCCDRPLPLPKLLFSRWDAGPVVDHVRVEDGELVLAALVAAREGVAPADDWRDQRVLPADRDPWIARAADAGRRFAAAYPVRRIVDPDGVSALVLERR